MKKIFLIMMVTAVVTACNDGGSGSNASVGDSMRQEPISGQPITTEPDTVGPDTADSINQNH